MPKDSAAPSIIPPEDIQELQFNLTNTDLAGFPSDLKYDHCPFWLLWAPTPNNYRSPNKPCTKLLKRPTNPRWQEPTETMTYNDLYPIYHKKQDFYEQCVSERATNPRRTIPIPQAFGFKYTQDHPFICFDLDAVTEENTELIEATKSYTEWSPSGNGAHVIIKCITVQDKIHLVELFTRGKRRLDVKRDLFIASGYVTVTGLLVPIAPKEVRTIDTTEIEEIINRFYAPSNVIKHPSLVKEEQKVADTISNLAPKGRSALVSSKYKPETSAKIKSMLSILPVKCLESDIFERLQRDELSIIDYTCEEESREPWLIIGQAIHHNFNGNLEGYSIWNEWSQEGNKYDADACEATWKSFKDLPEGQNPVTIGAMKKLYNAQRPMFPDRTAKGALIASLPNFDTYIKFYKFKCQQNEISKDTSIDIPKYVRRKFTLSETTNQVLSLRETAEYIHSDLHSHGFAIGAYNPNKISRFLSVRCRENRYNPVKDYFVNCGKEWDGGDHISSLVRTVKINPVYLKYTSSIHAFLRKWLIQVAAAACYNPKDTSIQINRVLIFSGPQGIGKTRWVKSLFPKALQDYCAADKDIRITGFRSDNVKMTMELVKILICNINEIDRLFNYANFSEIKAFFEKTEDNIVLPYGDTDTIMTRRTVFIGSTNREDFLIDPSGNRRFEVIPTINLDYNHKVDIDQVWGQVYNLYKKGERWWFDPFDAADMPIIKDRDQINSQSMLIIDEAFADELDQIFDVEEGRRTKKFVKMDFAAVNRHMTLGDFRKNSKSFRLAKQALTTWSKTVTGKHPIKGRGLRPRLYYYMPPLRTDEDPVPPDLDDITVGSEREELMKVIKQSKLAMMRLKQLNKEEQT